MVISLHYGEMLNRLGEATSFWLVRYIIETEYISLKGTYPR